MKQVLIVILLFLITLPCIAQWRYTGTNIEVLAIGAHDTSLFLSSDHDMFRFNPLGDVSAGLNFAFGNYQSFASLGTLFFTGSLADCAMLSNNGSSWKSVAGGLVCSNGTFIFSEYYGDVARSRDGLNWERLRTPPSRVRGNAVDGNCVYVTTGNDFWRSLDTGHTWIQLSPAPPFGGTMLTMGHLLLVYQNYRAAFDGSSVPHNGVLIMSRDSGMTWDTVHVDSAGVPEYVTAVATDGRNLFVGGVGSRQDPVAFTNLGNGFYVSADTGKHWRAVNDGLGDPAHAPMNIESIGIYLYDSAIYISTNNNNYGGSNPSFATYYRPIREVLDAQKSAVREPAPAGDTIEVFPNPSTGMVTILSGGTPVLGVRVLNVLGEAVLSIPTPRESSINFDISKLASGTYFVQIETAKGFVLRKIIRE